MSKYRKRLPQSHEHTFITDGGLETTLIYLNSVIFFLRALRVSVVR
jgi:hypothetical protein